MTKGRPASGKFLGQVGERPSASKTSASSKRSTVTAARFEEGEARVNFNVPASVHKAIRIRVAEQNLSIRDYFLRLLKADGIE
jgi:predicted DNA binding CopG/RHH family protein